jgi:hypothetical protein
MAHNTMTRVTRVANGDGNVELNSGESVLVWSIIIANASGSAITQNFTQGSGTQSAGDGSTNVATITVGASDSENWTPGAIFDRGFRIPEPAASVVVTVAWRPSV